MKRPRVIERPRVKLENRLNDRLQKKVKKSLADRLYAFHALFVGNPDAPGWVTINASDIGRPYVEELFTGGPRIAWHAPGELVPEWRGSVVNVPALVENIRIKLLLEQTFGGQISPTTPPDALAFLLAAAVSDQRLASALQRHIAAGFFFHQEIGDEVYVIHSWKPTPRGTLPQVMRYWREHWWPSARRRS
jgi:hypothetical protein